MVPFTPEKKTAGLRFRLGSVPVTIHWSFAILVVLFLLSDQRPWEYALSFGGVVLVSVLVHEMGHAAAFSAFGRRSSVVIYALAGLTISRDERPMRDGQAIVVSLAGPFAGAALGLLALWGQRTGMGSTHELTGVILSDTILVSLGYGLLNLIPMLPLDGGQVMQRIAGRIDPHHQHITPYVVSILVAVGAAITVWKLDPAAPGLLYALIAVAVAINVGMLNESQRERREEESRRRIDRGIALLGGGDPNPGIAALEDVAATEPRGPLFDRAALPLAWALGWRGAPGDAEKLAWLAGALAARHETSLLMALAARQSGRGHEAMALIARGFALEHTDPPPWYLPRVLPGTDDVRQAAAWIDQMDLAERHLGLSRLVDALHHAQRPADAALVGRLMLRPVAG
jgi:hypothetical protein